MPTKRLDNRSAAIKHRSGEFLHQGPGIDEQSQGQITRQG